MKEFYNFGACSDKGSNLVSMILLFTIIFSLFVLVLVYKYYSIFILIDVLYFVYTFYQFVQ